MRIGYIASHIYLHTFEINEAAELTRQHPDARVYSFYRDRRAHLQRKRVGEIAGEVVSWSYLSIVRGFFYLPLRHPAGFTKSALWLAFYSAPNPVYWFKNLAVFFAALPILTDARRHGVTHLHASFGSSPATIAWLGKRMLGTGLSITFHSFDVYSTALAHRDPLRKRKLRDADLVVTVHEAARRLLTGLVPGVDPGKFKVIRICVKFEPAEKLDPPPPPPLVVAAGNLLPVKGFDVLVRAVGLLKRRDVPVRLRILGEGPERPFLESLARECAVRDRVDLPGFFEHESLADHLAEAAVFVAPSRVTPQGLRDGIPTVVVEAWLSRTPVVASPVGGMGEVIVDGVTGLVFPPGDPEALADCIARVLASGDLGRRLAEGGYGAARRTFSPEKNVLDLLRAIGDHTKQAAST